VPEAWRTSADAAMTSIYVRGDHGTSTAERHSRILGAPGTHVYMGVTNMSNKFTRDPKATICFAAVRLDILLWPPRIIGSAIAIGAQEATMKASVEAAIRSSIRPGEVLPTPTGIATFVVDKMDAEGLSLLFGPKMTRTLLTWRCLEGVPGYMRGQEWVPVGANRDVNGNCGLDGYLKRWIKRQTANYVVVVLECAGVLELDRGRPAQVRLIDR
jgi:hypothetical protein